MAGPTTEEITAKLDAYKAAEADQQAKKQISDDARAAADTAVGNAEVAFNNWIAALQAQHLIEDELEEMVVTHEPPDVPTA